MSFPVKAVVLDWAGTMIDFGCMAPVRALTEVFAAEGLALSDAEARKDMGKAKLDHLRAAAGQSARLIPGAAEAVAQLRALGVRIGSGTGYTREMMADILPRAAEQGYAPEVVVCAGETPSGRPAPLMTWKALIDLDAWPAQACIKVDDAPVGIEEGRLAGCWTVGLSASGNGVGLDLDAWAALAPEARRERLAPAETALKAAGADFVIEDISRLPPLVHEIARRIAESEGVAA